MQVRTQAEQHASQIASLLAACQSMSSQYTIVEGQARRAEERALALQDWTTRGFKMVDEEFLKSKQSTSITKEAEATIVRLIDDVEKSKRNAEQSNEHLRQSLEANQLAAAAKQREELEQIRKDAIEKSKQNAEESSERLRQALEAKQRSAAAEQRQELEQIRKDAAEAKQLAMASSQRQQSALVFSHSSTSRPPPAGPPARKVRFRGDRSSADAMSDGNDEMSSDDERVPLTKDKGKGKLADRNSGKVRDLSCVCRPQH